MAQRSGWVVLSVFFVVGCGGGGGDTGTGGSAGTAGVGGTGGTAGSGGSGGMIDAPAPDAPMPDAMPDSSPDAGPTTPVFTGSTPPSPSNTSTTPALLGTADAGALVRLYTAAGCSGSVAAMGTADSSGHFSIGVTVGANSSTTFFATGDDAGLLSACSSGFTYVHDDVAPAAPVLSGTNPSSPSRSSTSPQVLGTAEAGATVRIYKSSDCSGSVASAGSSSGSFAIGVAVTPNASTNLSATATDPAGNVSGCSNSLVYLHDNVAPATPLLTGTIPASPSNSSTLPQLLGMTEPLAAIAIYVSPSCAGSPVAAGSADGSGSFSIAVAAGANTSTTWYATASDSIGNVSGCSMGFTYVHDDVAPATPMFTGLSPSSPSNTSTTPTLLGNAEAGSLVRVYAGGACSGSVAGSGTATSGGTFAIGVTVTQNSSTTFRVSATDAAGNVSGCSASITFTNDTVAPGAPVLTATNPSSPSNASTTPQIQGTAEAFATLRLYTGSGCGGSAISTTTVPANGSFAVGVTVGANTTTTFFADANDAAGNRSGCSNGIGYTHDNTPPPAPSLTGTNPASPSNTSTTPQVLGVAEGGSTVRLYTTSNCSGTVKGTGGAAAGNGAFSIGVSVSPNTSTTFFAAATDAAGNTGACSNGLTYTHDTIPPSTPTITASMPVSPSRISTTPLLSGTADPSTAIFLYTNSGCSGAFAAMGASTTGGTFSIGASVMPDTSTTFFAQAVDAAGNPSGCSGGFTYVHDDIAPAAPAITSSTPPSPSRSSTTPTLNGTAEAGATVHIYVGSCSTSSVASGTATGGAFAIGVSVSANSTTTFVADATDAAGNRGACSGGFTYVHDNTPPSPPTLTGISPPGPSDTNNVTVSGSAEVGSTVTLFRSSNCSGAPAGSTQASAGGSFSIPQSVPDNTTLAFSAIATDAAGNPSTCSNSLSYQEISPVISGTITYGGGCTGRIFVSVFSQNDSQRSAGGTSLAVPGAYQIRGIFERGPMRVAAWCDALGIGSENVGIDPTASASIPNYTGGPLTVNLTLVDPTPQTPPQSSVNVTVPIDSGIVGSWKQVTNSNNEEIADHYRFYVATSGTPGPGNNILSKTVKAANLQLAVLRPLTNGTTYQIGVAAINNGIEGPVSTPVAAVAGVPTGGATATGTVNFTGFTPSGDLYAIAYDSSQGGFTAQVSSPAASQAYSITGLPTALNDSFFNFAVLDANGDGELDPTEPTSIINNGGTTGFTIVSGSAVAPTVAITGNSGNFSVRTAHAMFGSEIFRNQLAVAANRKLPVTAVLTSGPGISPPVDLGMDLRPNFGPPELGTYFDSATSPAVGDTYSVDVTFLDGSTATLSGSVTGVVPLPTLTAPIGTGSTTPTFQWTNAAGGPYFLSINVSPNGCCGDLWHVEPLSGTRTSALFNFDGTASSPLVAGTFYQWSLNANDAFGNTSNVGAQFQAQ